MARLPLEGVRICDFSWVLVGPQATSYLALMGAEVIRVESMMSPCTVRMGQPWLDGQQGIDRSGSFAQLNLGKKGITLNLAKPEAVAIVKEIVNVSDIVMENFVPGVMARHGLSYEDLCRVKPDIVMASASMLGQNGPLRTYMGYGPDVQSLSGLTAMTGYGPGEMPRAVGGVWPDLPMAGYLAFCLLTALYHHRKTGEGQHIDWSMNDVVLGTLPEAVMDYVMNGRIRGMIRNGHEYYAPHGVYRCAGRDRWIAIACTNEAEWRALCGVLGDPEWSRDPRFATMYDRRQHQDDLDALINAWTKSFDHWELTHILQQAGVPAGASMDAEEFTDDPHLWERGFFVEIDHKLAGNKIYGGVPFKLQGVAPWYRRSPCIGEHNEDVFCGLLGRSREELDRLMEAQVVY